MKNGGDAGPDEAKRYEELLALAPSLPAALRSALAETWQRDASFEHASIASFNRFSLELLGLGAPAALVHGANRAACEEVEHARACFALASAYGGLTLGPGPLRLDGWHTGNPELASVAAAAAEEGCVGEALAAVEAVARLGHATVPIVQQVLSKIAEEERSHAALAVRFVRWAIECGGEPVRRHAEETFLAAVAACRRETAVARADDAQCLPHGVLPATERLALRQRALDEVILPTGRALFRA